MRSRETSLPGYAEMIRLIDTIQAVAGGSSVAVVLSKLGGLEGLNERFGYAATDAIIESFQQRLRGIAREHDAVLRLSSSCFAFLVHAPLNAGHVLLAAERIGRLADEQVDIDGKRLRLDVTMGCALLNRDEADAVAVIRRAETALRKCREGDQRVSLWDAGIMAAESDVAHPLFDARQAIENGEFRVHYQPQVRLADNCLIGAEALVRWRSPDGLVAPGSFMNEMERSRSLAPLLQFVMNTSSREMARWLRWAPELKVAINSSATDLEDSDLAGVMRDVLGMWGVDSCHIKLEITETSLMRNPQAGIATLHALRDMGIRTSIDDFGTGYSSLSWLKELPVDELKIDRSFVQRMTGDRRDRQLVQAIIDLAHALNLTVIAEGIECADSALLLRDMGCDIGQGYHFGRPVTSAEFERVWVAGNARAEVTVS